MNLQSGDTSDEITRQVFTQVDREASDIVTRVLAVGLDPAVPTTGDITWPRTKGGNSAGSEALRGWRSGSNLC